MDELRRNEPLHFTAARELYRLSAAATPGDVIDQLTAKLSQLTSMLNIVCGLGIENFRNCHAHVQNDYLWTCEQIASECKELAVRLPYPTVEG